jgi:putative hemolysin
METDPGRLPLIVQLLIIVILTYINAFFAKAEMAFVSLSKAKLKAIADDTTDGDARAEKVMLMLDDTNSFLSTIQVAITLAGFLSSAFASFNLSEVIVKLFAGWGVNLNPQLSVVIITLLLSYLTLVFGELLPKRLALRDPENTAMKSVNAIVFAKKFFTPFVKLLSASVQGMLKILGLEEEEGNSEYMAEEIMNLLEEGQEQGEIDESGKDMINAVFEFDDVFAYEIMTPRTDVYMVDINEPIGNYVDEMLEERYARIPFYGEDIDDIIGILYIKDYILEARKCGFENVDIKSILKKPYFVPENKKINELLDEMQKDKQSMAVLIDEYGGFSGVVTIEDLLEEIVGNISDEYEDDEPQLIKRDDHTYVIDGLFTLDDLEEETGIALTSESDNSATVGGFVMELSGEVPDEKGSIGKEFCIDNYEFRILAVKDRRIERVKLTVLDEPENTAEAE